jgi:ribosomal protein S18 acetylase RimI-like enzyme
MEQFKFISNYMKNDKYRKSFNELAMKTFNINFEEWFKDGYLDENYINYSLICEENVVANVSANKFNVIYNGEPKKAIQIGTVMTSVNYRNKGLGRELMNHVLEEYNDYDLIYLYANDSALDFYPKFGFKRVIEGKYEMDLKEIEKIDLNNDSIIKLDLKNEEHKIIINKLALNRISISQKLGLIKDIWPLKVYCNYEYNNDLYYIKEDNIIVILRRENNIVKLYDILSVDKFNLDNVILKIIREEDKKIQFNFIAESEKYKFDFKLEDNIKDALFVKEGKLILENGILFPKTSHT